MPTFAQDLIFYQQGIRELEQYLLSGELYWPLSGSRDLPRLTIGGLLLAGKRLQARSLSLGEQADLAGWTVQMEAVRSKWRSAWERKAGREVHARFELWRNYLEDYRESPEEQAGAYPQQIRWRVMLDLLKTETTKSLPEFSGLEGLDQVLKSCLISGAFVWEPELIPAFPEDEYWYLYGKLKSSR